MGDLDHLEHQQQPLSFIFFMFAHPAMRAGVFLFLALFLLISLPRSGKEKTPSNEIYVSTLEHFL